MSRKARNETGVGEEVELGVVQFHPQKDLRERFYEAVDDLARAGCVVDLWMTDLAAVFEEFGYELKIRRID